MNFDFSNFSTFNYLSRDACKNAKSNFFCKIVVASPLTILPTKDKPNIDRP